MLAFVEVAGRGEADRLLADVAAELRARNVRLAGVVQRNVDHDAVRRCHMDLDLLDGVGTFRISQDLGLFARGCRLDAGALEQAVGLVEAALAGGRPELVIVNKFGKQECDGRGFRPVIAAALAQGVPVLTAVSAGNRAAFDAFAEGMAERLDPSLPAVLEWCRAHLA